MAVLRNILRLAVYINSTVYGFNEYQIFVDTARIFAKNIRSYLREKKFEYR